MPPRHKSNPNSTALIQKQVEFSDAMRRFDHFGYARSYTFISLLNVGLQFVLIYLALQYSLAFSSHVICFIVAYIVADLVNGLVHLLMDNNAHYTSVLGPFVAQFHLHHHRPRYTDRPLWRVYIEESGSKIWLVVTSLDFASAMIFIQPPSIVVWFGVYFVLASAFAELSHYLCHNTTHPVVIALQKLRVLLPKNHHNQHHIHDNINYAFLNGVTDPLINWIARKLQLSYKDQTDLHFELYLKHVKNV